MNIEIWCKSFLSIYSLLPSLVKSIDKLVYLKSVSSSGFSRVCNHSTFNEVDKIASLTQKKVNLINLKLLCDEVLVEMDDEGSKLIMLRYIDGMYYEDIILLLNLTRRTYFRKLAKALKDFQIRLYKKILKNRVLYNNFLQDDFFNDIFEKINLIEEKLNIKNAKTINYSNSLCNLILRQLKRAF